MDSRRLSPDELEDMRRLASGYIWTQTYRGFDGCLLVQAPADEIESLQAALRRALGEIDRLHTRDSELARAS